MEEAVAARYADEPELARKVLASVQAFVALAEEKKRETGKPRTVRLLVLALLEVRGLSYLGLVAVVAGASAQHTVPAAWLASLPFVVRVVEVPMCSSDQFSIPAAIRTLFVKSAFSIAPGRIAGSLHLLTKFSERFCLTGRQPRSSATSFSPAMGIICFMAILPAASQAFATPFTGTYTFVGTTGTNNPFAYNGTDIAGLTEGDLGRTNLPSSSTSGNYRSSGFALDLASGSLTGSYDPARLSKISPPSRSVCTDGIAKMLEELVAFKVLCPSPVRLLWCPNHRRG
ncbi:MAG: hypothetical protein ACKOOF_10590 [Planctomycetaceae bacterium]